MKNEQDLQAKILEWLRDNGFYARKVIKANKSGVPDILGCTPSGRMFAIEVKWGANTPSELQLYNIEEVNKRGGIAFVTWDIETVIARLQNEISR